MVAGLIEKAAGLWGKAGQRSLESSALVEAEEQFKRALAQITALPATPALRRAHIKLQIGLINALMHTKGDAAPDTKASLDQARSLIEQAEALGEALVDEPLLLLSVLNGFWLANYLSFNGDALRELAAQFLALAEKHGATVQLMIGHRLMGTSELLTGDFMAGRAHFDRWIALYAAAGEHRALATRFGIDHGTMVFCHRSWALWFLGYPDAALADVDHALRSARELGQAATLMPTLCHISRTHISCGNYAIASALIDELIALADEKGAAVWKETGLLYRGSLLVITGKASVGLGMLTSGLTTYQSTGATAAGTFLSLAAAYAQLGQFEDARRSIEEAMTAVQKTKERWFEADIHRVAGQIALMSPEPDTAKAEAHFERALAVARAQQAKSWELRAATSMARLWRDQGKREEARDLLAPFYNWFTEGFDTLDLKETKALLDELA